MKKIVKLKTLKELEETYEYDGNGDLCKNNSFTIISDMFDSLDKVHIINVYKRGFIIEGDEWELSWNFDCIKEEYKEEEYPEYFI